MSKSETDPVVYGGLIGYPSVLLAAESLGVENLDVKAAELLAEDLSYQLRNIIHVSCRSRTPSLFSIVSSIANFNNFWMFRKQLWLEIIRERESNSPLLQLIGPWRLQIFRQYICMEQTAMIISKQISPIQPVFGHDTTDEPEFVRCEDAKVFCLDEGTVDLVAMATCANIFLSSSSSSKLNCESITFLILADTNLNFLFNHQATRFPLYLKISPFSNQMIKWWNRWWVTWKRSLMQLSMEEISLRSVLSIIETYCAFTVIPLIYSSESSNWCEKPL